jgi:hypothetical protein
LRMRVYLKVEVVHFFAIGWKAIAMLTVAEIAFHFPKIPFEILDAMDMR